MLTNGHMARPVLVGSFPASQECHRSLCCNQECKGQVILDTLQWLRGLTLMAACIPATITGMVMVVGIHCPIGRLHLDLGFRLCGIRDLRRMFGERSA